MFFKLSFMKYIITTVLFLFSIYFFFNGYNSLDFSYSNKLLIQKNLKSLYETKVVNLKKPVICEIIMNNEQEQMPKAINRRDKHGKTTPTTFEDMYPFLSKGKLKESTYEFYVNRGKGEKK